MFQSRSFRNAAFIGLGLILILVSFSVSASSDPAIYATGFQGPFGMAFNDSGDLFVANEHLTEAEDGISRVTLSGDVFPFASGFRGASGVAFNSLGFLHVSDDSNRIFSITETGMVSVLVDSGIGLDNPNAIAIDQADNLYVVSAGGFVSKFNDSGGLIDLRLAEDYSSPEAILVDNISGDLFISDIDGNVYRINKDTGVSSLYVRTYAYTDGGLAQDADGNLFLSALHHGLVLRIDALNQSVTTCLDGLSEPRGLVFDSAGNLYVTSYDTGVIYLATAATGCDGTTPPPSPYPAHFAVEVTSDQVWGSDWQANNSVSVSVDGGTAHTSPTDEWGHFHLDLWGKEDLVAGQPVVVNDGVSTLSYVITNLVVTEVNADTDEISGSSTPGIDVFVDVWGVGGTSVTPSELGGWTVNVSSFADLVPGVNGTTGQVGADGNSTEYNWYVPNPHFYVYRDRDHVEGWSWLPNATVTLTVDDPGNGSGVDHTASMSTDMWGDFNYFDFSGIFDLQTGHIVTVTDGTYTKVHQVTALAVTNINAAADTVSGEANAGAELYIGQLCAEYGCAARIITADGSGYWVADFSISGTHPGIDGLFDILPGTGSSAYEFDDDIDGTVIDWYLPNPAFDARPEGEEVNGWEWPLDSSVDLTIDDPSTPEDPDYTETQTSYLPVWDPNQTHVDFYFEGEYELKAGDLVTLTDGVYTKSHTVTSLRVTDVDLVNDVLYGVSDSGDPINFWTCNELGCSNRSVTPDFNGYWSADFGEPGENPEDDPIFDLVPGSEIGMEQRDVDGDNTRIDYRVPAPDLRIWKWPEGDPGVGGNFTFHVDYRNEGDADAVGVTITDILSDNLVYISDTSGISPTGAGTAASPLIWDLGTLPAGSRGNFDVFVQVDGGVTDPVSNHIEIRSGDFSSESDWNSEIVPNDTYLHLNKDSWTGDPAPGTNIVFSINVCNTGSTDSSTLTLTDDLSPEMTVEGWWADEQGWVEVGRSDHQLILSRPSIMSYRCTDVYVKAHLGASVPVDTSISNTATIAATNDLSLDDNESTWWADVSNPHTNLYINKWWDQGQLVPGGEIHFGVSYGNDGNVPVSGPILITDTLPDNTFFKNAYVHGPDGPTPFPPTQIDGNQVIWDIGGLENGYGEHFEIVFNVSETATAGTDLTNTVEISPQTVEDNFDDNVASVSETVRDHGPNLRVRKWHGWEDNTRLNYGIRLENVGDEEVANVLVTDTYPAGTSFNGDWGHDFWEELVFTHDELNGELIWELNKLLPGWTTDIRFNVDLSGPWEPMTSYTNVVSIGPSTDDTYLPDNTYTDEAFTGPEVDWVQVEVGNNNIWVCAREAPITISHAGEVRVLEDSCIHESLENDFEPGDTVTVEAGAGYYPVLIQIPNPFTVQADSENDRVWGQIDALDQEWIEVDLHQGPTQNVQTGTDGSFSTIFSEIPRGGSGEVRYTTDINYTEVTFSRQFQTMDLFLFVNFSDDWVQVSYPAGHDVTVTVTEGEGGPVKATAIVETEPGQGMGGYGGGSTGDWDPEHPDIQPGDWIYGETDDGRTTDVGVGDITGNVDVNADNIRGTIDASWLSADVHVQCHPWDSPEGAPHIYDMITPDGIDEYECAWDPDTEWDVQPAQDIAVMYWDPSLNWVTGVFYEPAPYLRVEKWTNEEFGEGGNSYFGIRYYNDGDAPAENVTITDELSAGLIYLLDTSEFPHSDPAAGPIVWDLGTLPANSSGVFYVIVQVTAAEGVEVSNLARISTTDPYDQGDPSEKEAEWIGVVRENDTQLDVGKDSWTGDPAPGTDFVFNINVCNHGSTPSSELILRDDLPPELTLVEWWSQHQGWTEVSRGVDHLEVSRIRIPSYWCGEVYLKVHVDPLATSGTNISNTAVISASNDTTPDDNESTWEGQVSDPHANLYVYKWWNWGSLVPGGEIRYNIRYGNNGNAPVSGPIYIIDTPPGDTTFKAAWLNTQFDTLPFPPTQSPSGELVWEIDGLANGYDYQIELILDVDGGATPGTELINTVSITEVADEDTHDDNEDSWAEVLQESGPNLRVRKWHHWNGDGQLYYNIRAENVGDTDVFNVSVIDTYPEDTTFNGNWGHDYWDDVPLDEETPGQLIWNIDHMNPGDRVDIWFTVDLNHPGTPMIWYTNLVEISPTEGDTNLGDNTYTREAFSGGEVDWVELNVGRDDIWGCAPVGLITITHVRAGEELEEKEVPESCFSESIENTFQPGDVVTVTAGAGTNPVVIELPIPFDVWADSETEEVWGQIDHLDQGQVAVELDGAPTKYVQITTDGQFSATFSDVPRGGSGKVRYTTEIDYADVTFHRDFYTFDLIMTVDYGHDWVGGNYASGYPLLIRVTESDGATEKGRAELITGPIPDWGGQSGFNVRCEDWVSGDCPDIEPGDWVFGDVTVDSTVYTSTVQVGTIDGEVNVDADTVSGTLNAIWLLPDWVPLNCEIHEEDGRSIHIAEIDPDNGTFFCDFGGMYDIVEQTNVAVNYQEPDGDWVQNHLYSRFLQVRVNQSHNWVDGWTTPGSTIVVTIWRDGLPIMAQMTDNGNGNSWYMDFCCGDEEYEIREGDKVEIATSLGLNAMIDVIPMTGVVDAGANTISGQVFGVPDGSTVRGNPQHGSSVESATDADGNYTVHFIDDVLAGHNIELWYIREDGHQVGISKAALRLNVDASADRVDGETAPDMLVSVTINGETVEATSDAEGNFHEMYFDHDIVAGETVEAIAGNQAVSLILLEVSAQIDDLDDKVWGYGPPSGGDRDNISVQVNDDEHWTSTDSLGYYEVIYDYNITPDDRLRVRYEYPENHSVQYGFGPSDVRVDKWAPIWNVSPGDEFTYIINVNNDWSGTATGVEIVDTLPMQVAYVPSPGDLGPVYYPSTHTLVWDIGTFGGEHGREIEFRVRLDENAEWGSRLNNYVDISADSDRDPGNNSSWTTVDVRPPGADFWVQKEIVSGHAIPGGEITYQVRFGNNGTSADPAVITDLLPIGTSFVESTFEVGVDGVSETDFGDRIVWDLGDLQPGGDDEEHSFEFTLLIDSEPGDFLTNEIFISPDTSQWADNRDNRHLFNTVVGTEGVDLWVDKVIEGDLSSTDSEIIYRITFHNDGSIPAENVTIIDTLPSALEHVWHSAESAIVEVDGTITWGLGTIQPGGGGEVILATRLVDPGAPPTVMTNEVEISSTTFDHDQSNNQAEAVLGPPVAIAVPWIGDDPHRVWPGLETTLKGVAKGYGLTEYEWDFGDGDPSVSGWIDDPYAIETKHTYTGAVGVPVEATLTVWGAFGWSDSDVYHIQIFDGAIFGVQKDVAIDEGLWYLHKSAERYRVGGLPLADWSQDGNRAAEIATAIQAFQVHGHLPGGDPLEDPYVEDVRSGWNKLFTYAVLDPMSMQAAGDPEPNGNGVGVGIYENYGHSIYESGLAMMALASSGAPDRVAQTGPFTYVRGQTYEQIAQDMADWFAWGQNDESTDPWVNWARGGWRYQPNSGDSDNSNTQFPVLGLAAAEENWGITVPDWVKTELVIWLGNTQNGELNDNNGGFGYSGPEGMLNVSKTGAGIMDLIWAGVAVDDDRVTRAVDYIERHWFDLPDPENYIGNVGDFYAMYAVKKGSQFAGIHNYGLHPWDFEYSSYLVDIQAPDGHFDEDPTQGSWFRNWQPMSTSWALLILSPGLYEPLPVAVIREVPSCLENQLEVPFDGTLSYHIDPTVLLDTYEWDFGDETTASGAGPLVHTYVEPGQYLVSLTVTDENGLTDTETMLLTIDNVPPVLGPVSVSDTLVAVNEKPIGALARFSDPCVLGEHYATWNWGEVAYDPYLIVTEPLTSSHTYTEAGVYTVQLTVTDPAQAETTSEFKYIVVYDPEGGFVTGGGWIDSPAGAYPEDPSLVGKANFGFVSKYKKGANVPTGQTEFQFHVADLNFHSDIYDWLVVADSKAMYKGTGTINGEGEYKFMLTALDADINENDSHDVDRFRIKIWYEDGDGNEFVIYDNGLGGDDDDDNATTEISGGSIVIHKK